jgi:hypothetical protein
VPPVAPMPKPAEHKKPADEKGDKK